MKTKLPNPTLWAGLAAIYFVAGKLGVWLAGGYQIGVPVWPPAGIALAAVLLAGSRVWPGVALGAFVTAATSLAPARGQPFGLVAASFGVSLGNTVEALAGAWLVQRFAQGREAFRQPHTIFVFIALAAVLNPALSAGVGSSVVVLAGLAYGQNLAHLWLDWWQADMLSIIVLTPLLLILSSDPWPKMDFARVVEAAALLLLVLPLSWVAFGGWFGAYTDSGPLGFLVIPVLLWAALRWGERGTAAVALLLVFLATAETLHGHGLFAVANRTMALLLLQNFLAIVTVMWLVLAAGVAQRRRIEEGLRASEERYRELSELGRRLSAARTHKEAAQIIMGSAEALFGWDACTFDLLDADQKSLSSVLYIDTIDGRREEIPPQCLHRKPGACIREVLEHGATLMLRPLTTRFPPESLPFGDKTRPSASLMFVPLRKDAQTIGILSIQSYLPEAYTKADLRTLQVLADHCGGALERIRAEQEIERLNRELRQRIEELQLLFEVAPVGIAVARDRECRVINVNRAGAALLGTNGQTNISKNGAEAGQLAYKFLRDGREVPPEELPMQRAARQGAPVLSQELDVVFADGRVVNSYVAAAPLFDDAGHTRGSLGVMVDLSHHKEAEREILRLNAELERRVCDRTAQLEAINKELEAFSYSVSHDLRAPVRSIRGFSEVLLKRYASKLDGAGQELLRRTCESCTQMYNVIEDLLHLSRVGRSELHRQSINLSKLAEAVADELRRAEPKRPVKFIAAPGLEAWADERMLRLVLENLLRNAWKFTTKTPKPLIEFGLTDGAVPAFFVRDNGAGFDMAHSQKLFGVFQRLHSERDFPGTGIGLATVQRIINRHAGRVWAEGAVNRGATIYFALPPNEDV
ncbi:MAG TPA: MASE1 domain-containing protein [Candidatus Binatia bacterium]|jgi:PAS domain S-box-containing protein|nr:MASE1 domain-containing protein [Candidatus Binatia bacterium]